MNTQGAVERTVDKISPLRGRRFGIVDHAVCEMPHQLHFWIGDDLKEILQDYADTRHLSIAAAVRVLLYQALTDKKEDQPWDS